MRRWHEDMEIRNQGMNIWNWGIGIGLEILEESLLKFVEILLCENPLLPTWLNLKTWKYLEIGALKVLSKKSRHENPSPSEATNRAGVTLDPGPSSWFDASMALSQSFGMSWSHPWDTSRWKGSVGWGCHEWKVNLKGFHQPKPKKIPWELTKNRVNMSWIAIEVSIHGTIRLYI